MFLLSILPIIIVFWNPIDGWFLHHKISIVLDIHLRFPWKHFLSILVCCWRVASSLCLFFFEKPMHRYNLSDNDHIHALTNENSYSALSPNFLVGFSHPPSLCSFSSWDEEIFHTQWSNIYGLNRVSLNDFYPWNPSMICLLVEVHLSVFNFFVLFQANFYPLVLFSLFTYIQKNYSAVII